MGQTQKRQPLKKLRKRPSLKLPVLLDMQRFIFAITFIIIFFFFFFLLYFWNGFCFVCFILEEGEIRRKNHSITTIGFTLWKGRKNNRTSNFDSSNYFENLIWILLDVNDFFFFKKQTDTASVLHEAMGYIKFLHEQVQVLCSPYLQKSQLLSSQSATVRTFWLKKRTFIIIIIY